MNEQIRILLVDNHAGVREALTCIINAQADMIIAGEASNGNTAIQLFPLIDPDITLIDLNMPEVDGQTVIRAIKQLHPEAKFIAMSSFDFEEDIEACYEAGATAFLTKDTTRDILLNIVRSVYSGSFTRPQMASEKESNVFFETKDRAKQRQE